MLRLTFTDSKKQTKILGDAEGVGELYQCLYNHAKRLFLHPTICAPGNLTDPRACYIVGQTKDGCFYQMENLAEK